MASIVNSSSIQSSNHKKNFLVLVKGDDINDDIVTVENKFSINFTNLKTNFTLKGLTFDQSKQICKFKAFDNIPP